MFIMKTIGTMMLPCTSSGSVAVPLKRIMELQNWVNYMNDIRFWPQN